MTTWKLTRHGKIGVATYTHAPRNLMTFADMAELETVVTEVAGDDSLTVLVIASDLPGYYVAHGDLGDLVAMGSGAEMSGDPMSWPRTLELFSTMPQVVVAAINGQAWGGGLEMTLAMTLRVAGPRADLALCEVGIGLIPGGGGTQRLPRLIGEGRAAEMILSTRSVLAEEALRIGLVQAVLPDEPDRPFIDAVLAWVGPISERSPAALRAAKKAVLAAAHIPLAEGLALEGELVGPLLSTSPALEMQQAAIATYAATPADQTVRF